MIILYFYGNRISITRIAKKISIDNQMYESYYYIMHIIIFTLPASS